MTPKRTVTVDADVLERYEQLAQETGESVDELANEAMKRSLPGAGSSGSDARHKPAGGT